MQAVDKVRGVDGTSGSSFPPNLDLETPSPNVPLGTSWRMMNMREQRDRLTPADVRPRPRELEIHRSDAKRKGQHLLAATV